MPGQWARAPAPTPALTKERRFMPDAPLYLLRNRESRPVSPIAVPQQLIGFVIADHLLGRRVEVQRPAQAVRDVGKVNQRRRDMAFFHRRGQIFPLTAAHAIDEVGEMVFRRAPTGARFALLAEPGFVRIVLLNSQVSL